jgi:hypothetical protein
MAVESGWILHLTALEPLFYNKPWNLLQCEKNHGAFLHVEKKLEENVKVQSKRICKDTHEKKQINTGIHEHGSVGK